MGVPYYLNVNKADTLYCCKYNFYKNKSPLRGQKSNQGERIPPPLNNSEKQKNGRIKFCTTKVCLDKIFHL